MSHLVHCPHCARDTQAEKRHGFAPGRKSGRCGWWTVCCECGKATPGMPPGSTERLAAHHAEKVSAQLPMFGAAPKLAVARAGRRRRRMSAGAVDPCEAEGPAKAGASAGDVTAPSRGTHRPPRPTRTLSIVDAEGKPLL